MAPFQIRPVKNVLISFLMLAIPLGFLTGCGKGSSTVENKPDSTQTTAIPLPQPPCVVDCEPGIPGGRAVISNFGDPKTFNPITQNESSSDDVIRLLFWGLVNFDLASAEPKPGLAHSWEVAADQKTWTFHLRSNLFWSDGKPLTADDVVFTWKDVIYNPDIPNANESLYKISGKQFEISKVDDLTVKVVTPEVYAAMLETFASVPIIPKHVLEESVKAKNFRSAYGVTGSPEEIVCNGPYKLKSCKSGQSTLIVRNPYFLETDKKGQRLPYFDSVLFTVVPDQHAVSLQFLQHECDVNERVLPDEVERYEEKSKTAKFQFLDLGTAPEASFFWFNQNTNSNPKTGKPYVEARKLALFRDVRFRQAMAYALDRQSIIKSVYHGRAVENYGFINGAKKKWLNTNLVSYAQNIEKAKALLAELGFKKTNADGYLEDSEGNIIEFSLNTNTGNPIREQAGQLIVGDLKKLGIKANYQPIEFNSLVDRIDNSFDYECILMGLTMPGSDPVNNMNVLKSDGFTHQWFPMEKSPSTPWEARIDELMDSVAKTLDFSERKKQFDEVQAIMNEQMPLIYTVSPRSYAAIRSDIANVRPTLLSYYRLTWNAEELYSKP